MYALINDRELPVESLRSVFASPLGAILIAGAAGTDEDRNRVQEVLSNVHKKDTIRFNVVTDDWKELSGRATVKDIRMAARSKTKLTFYISVKIAKGTGSTSRK